jgi:hypothetical protein
LFDLPSFAQWKVSKCGALSVQEWNDLLDLSWQSANGTLPKNMVGYTGYLNQREQEIHQCGLQAVVVARWKLHAAGSPN